jgi:NAD(P)-dependent dehydrogenase (short-subunit alcohol dehydrogenase family)
MANYFITGTNRGLGLEFVSQLAKRGETVFATCRDLKNASQLVDLSNDNKNVHLIEMDVAENSSRERGLERIQDEVIDVVINNAGIYGPRNANFGELKEDDWSNVFQTNVIAPLLLTQLIIERVRNSSIKKLIFLTSKMGSIEDNQGGGAYIYRSSKSALNAAVKSVSIDLRSQGFIAAMLHPGWVRTDMGGPNGLIDTQTSVQGMVSVIDTLTAEQSGGFLNYDGQVIPW